MFNTLVKFITKKDISRWALPTLLMLFMSFYVLPRRSIGLTNDVGLFITLSWQLASGHGLDSMMLPQSPSYVFNAILMSMGLHEIFWLRLSNVLLNTAAAFLLFNSLNKRHFPNFAIPLAVSACASVTLYSIQGPNSLAMNFFMLGLGTVFSVSTQSDFKRNIFHVLAGILLAFAGFMHAIVAVFIPIWILISICLGQRHRLLLFVYSVVSALMWAWYINKIGLDIFFSSPKAHSGQLAYLANRGISIIRFYTEIAFFSLFCFLFFVFCFLEKV